MVTFLNFRKVTVGGMRRMDEGAGFGWETAERLMKQSRQEVMVGAVW